MASPHSQPIHCSHPFVCLGTPQDAQTSLRSSHRCPLHDPAGNDDCSPTRGHDGDCDGCLHCGEHLRRCPAHTPDDVCVGLLGSSPAVGFEIGFVVRPGDYCSLLLALLRDAQCI